MDNEPIPGITPEEALSSGSQPDMTIKPVLGVEKEVDEPKEAAPKLPEIANEVGIVPSNNTVDTIPRNNDKHREIGDMREVVSEKEKNRKDKVSVVTVLYNSAGVIEDLLDSIKETNKDGLIGEVIVVDNNSQDDRVNVVEKYISEHTNPGYEIKLIKNDENLGYGRGNNIGARVTTRPFILFSNPDIVFKENVVGEMADLLTANQKVGIVGPRIYIDNPSGYTNPVINPLSHIYRNLMGGTTIGKLMGAKPVRQGEYSKSFQVIGAFMMARTKEFLQVGGFDENNFLYLEELMLSERMRNAGLETVKLHTSQEIGHRISHSQFISSGDAQEPPMTKLDLYRKAEEHYVKNYMHNVTGNAVLDFLIRQIARTVYSTRNLTLIKPIYSRWLRHVGRDEIRDPTVK